MATNQDVNLSKLLNDMPAPMDGAQRIVTTKRVNGVDELGYVPARAKDLAETATEADLVAGSFFALDTTDKTKRLPAEIIGGFNIYEIKHNYIENEISEYYVVNNALPSRNVMYSLFFLDAGNTFSKNCKTIIYRVEKGKKYKAYNAYGFGTPNWCRVCVCASLVNKTGASYAIGYNNFYGDYTSTTQTANVDFTPSVDGYAYVSSYNGVGDNAYLVEIEDIEEKISVKEKIKEISFSSGKNRFYGKKIGVVGTSVCFGVNSEKSYVDEACKILGAELCQFSVPGQAIQTGNDGGVYQYGSTTLSKAEYSSKGWNLPSSPIPYKVNGNYNDYYRTWENIFTEENADIYLWIFATSPNNGNFDITDLDNFNTDSWSYKDGSSFESHRKSFVGAMLFLMDKMYSINPFARMVLVLDSSFSYVGGKAVFKSLQDKWKIPVVDIWGKMNTSPKSLEKLKSNGGTDQHPSTFAHDIMGSILSNELLLIG